MNRFALILNFPPFVGAEPLLPLVADALDADWVYIDPLCQLLEHGSRLPDDLAWGLEDAITAVEGASLKGRSIVLGWRAPKGVFRSFEDAVASRGAFVAAVTFATPMNVAMEVAGRQEYPEAAKHEVRQFYRHGCHRLSRGIVWEGDVSDISIATLILSRWLRRWIGVRDALRFPSEWRSGG